MLSRPLHVRSPLPTSKSTKHRAQEQEQPAHRIRAQSGQQPARTERGQCKSKSSQRTEHSQCRSAGRQEQGSARAGRSARADSAVQGTGRQCKGAGSRPSGSGEGGGGLFVTRMGRLFLAPSRKFLNFSRLAPARTALPAPAHCRPPRPQRPCLLLPGILAA